MSAVLDAWALVALALGEAPAAGRVLSLLDDAAVGGPPVSMSRINLGEACYTLHRRLGQEAADRLWRQAELMSVRWMEATAPRVQAAARIKATHRLSYADAFAVAAAQELDATLWTGDPELIALGDVCRVEVLKRGGGAKGTKSPRSPA